MNNQVYIGIDSIYCIRLMDFFFLCKFVYRICESLLHNFSLGKEEKKEKTLH